MPESTSRRSVPASALIARETPRPPKPPAVPAEQQIAQLREHTWPCFLWGLLAVLLAVVTGLFMFALPWVATLAGTAAVVCTILGRGHHRYRITR